MYRLTSISLLALLLSACSSSDVLDTDTAEGAYQLAEKYEKDERFEEAISYYKEVKNTHPYSRLATESELAIADIQFQRESYSESEVSYRVFKELHPSHSKIAYVTFQLAMSIFKQLPDSIDRDLTSADRAIIYFDEVITSFSQSEYAGPSKERKLDALKMLAEKQIYIADWYFGQKQWLSALGRYDDILGQHGNLGFDKKALMRAALSAHHLKDVEKTKLYFQKLSKRFPNSDELSSLQKELGI